MTRFTHGSTSLFLTIVATTAGCRGSAPAESTAIPQPVHEAPRTVQPGAPGQDTRTLPPSPPGAMTPAPHSAADVAFIHGMIPHHAQALEMAALVAGRTERQEIHLLARRIALSQRDEIDMMQRWLATRDEPAGDEHAHHAHGDHAYMPGMLTTADIARLAAARNTAFDRLFIEYMIRHHQGALTMVTDLFKAPDGGQEPELYQFAAHVEADQQMEIERMRRLLVTLP
ncbi:MAG TPA: DUF305 domain-containing protein [Gemmatimonadales bacterium]|nr:DUF305 domain-containing protein [Gemmatimonadales bacterium]